MKKFATFVLALSLMASIAGCASQSTGQTKATEDHTKESQTSQAVTGSAGTISVTNGEMPLPEKFDNFIAFGITHLDHLAALDVLPVAAAMPKPPTDPDSPSSAAYYNDGFGRIYPNGELDGVEALSTKFDASIERIIELAPDFIIAMDSDEKYLDKLEAVAPTYLIPGFTTDEATGMRDWKEVHRLIGKLVGKSEKAEENIAAYEALVKDYQEKIGDSVKGKTALIYQISSTGKGLWMSSKESAPQIYSEFGFALPENFTLTGDYYAVEELVTLNPDYMFINIGSVEEYEKLTKNPIWENLTAVKEGHVYEYSHYAWTQTNGYLSNTLKLKDVGDFLLDGTQTGSNLSGKS